MPSFSPPQLSVWFFELPSAVKRPVIGLIFFLIIVVPAWIFQTATQSAYDASRWVSHTYLVEARSYRLLFDLRDAEALVRTHLLTLSESTHPFSIPLDTLQSDIDEIARQTIDNPRQQERLDRLRAIVEGRIALLQQSMQLFDQGKKQQAGALLQQSIEIYPFRDLTDQILKEENSLLQARLQDAARKQRLATAILWAAVVAQLALSGTIYFISEKDLARRRRAEQQSVDATVHAERIVEINPDPLIVLDRHLRIRHVNKAFTDLYGGTAAEAQNRFLKEVSEGAWDLPELHQRLADLIPQNREIWDWEVEQKAKGERRVLLVNARPFPGMGGQKLILLSAKDVTARKRSEEQIHQLNQELSRRVDQAQAVNQELEAFSYSVSHDLRAPLRHIIGFGDMLQAHVKNAPPDAKRERYLGFILEAANQMGNLIDDLLVFSRMGRAEMAHQEVDMAALVHEVVAGFELERKDRKIDFVIGSLPLARGDTAMLRLVWMNLIGNAIKYSRTRETARIEIGAQSSETGEKIYFVRDNGVGFNMKYVHKLFGVFQRLHQAEEYEGTGIGLANVRRIVQRHGGKVWAEGEIDKGATLYFSLPLNPPVIVVPDAPPRAVPVNLHSAN